MHKIKNTEMGRKIIFNVTEKGASHEKSGKPCQDYSLSWESDDKQIQIVVVCDGHGGDTYVRSDVGSKLAAEIALSNIRSFIDSTSPAMFLGKSAAVTARPNQELDSLFPSLCKVKQEKLTEIEEEQLSQDNAFYAAVNKIREQDYLFTRLFASIHLQWLSGIKKDESENPFTDEEKSHLRNADIVKAYGSTLMAFARTPLYWFAFQIGDGKMVSCDRNMTWIEPVPWDCKCFLNVTTSLCNSNPVPMFRYAFSGKGDFPVAVILGSDGLDDSWGTMEALQNFYSQTLSIFNKIGEKQAVKELAVHLSEVSKKASRDDMSMAGIVDMDEIKDAIAIYNMQREIRALKHEKEKWESGLSNLKEQYVSLEKELSRLTVDLEKEEFSFQSWWKSLSMQKSRKENDLEKEKENLRMKKLELENLRISYEKKNTEFQTWFSNANKNKDDLEQKISVEMQNNEMKEKEKYELWVQAKEAFERNEMLN